MANDRNHRAKLIFEEAIDRPAHEREVFVDEACGDDAALRDEVRSLLEHFPDTASGLLVTPPEAWGVADELRVALRGEPFHEGEHIGRYVIQDRMGEGGMSLVYRAAQSTPVRRDVAVKVLKPGMDSSAVLARFETERHVLAAMDHPNIARVFDAGVSPRGHAYVVMELVRGVPIHEFCDSRRLDLHERLTLFRDVCHAIQHAHMRGIIHRDLKPSNILVVDHEGRPAPKIIDFGVAKALYARDALHQTQAGQPIGTPAYMSPEQWDADVDIDTRADVYALGVVLYELMTGHYPYAFETVGAGQYGAVRATMERTEPIRTSTRIVTADGPDPSPVGNIRRADLARLLRGDIDWILLMALAKDRDRRYRSAEAFAEDLLRFIERRPIEARPPSVAYRAKMFVRRNPTLAAVGALAGLGVLLASGAVAYHVARVGDELDLKEEARTRAESAEAVARNRAETLESVVEFQSEQLGKVIPVEMGTRLRARIIEAAPISRRDALRATLDQINFTNIGLDSMQANLFDPARAAISEQFADQPLIEASLLDALAANLRDLGLRSAAREPQTRALEIRTVELGPEHSDTLASMHALGSLLHLQGEHEDAERYLRASLQIRRRILEPDDPRILSAVNNLGTLLDSMGRYEESEQCYREALDGCRRVHGEDHPSTLTALNNLGLWLRRRGRLEESAAALHEALERRRKVLGDDHPDTLNSVSSVGMIIEAQGDAAGAEPYYQEALAGRRRVLGDLHPDTLGSINNMGYLLGKLGRPEASLAAYSEALSGVERTLGPDHRHTMRARSNLGFELARQGALETAEVYYREALGARRRVLGVDHPDTLSSMHNLAFLLQARERPDDAEAMFRAAAGGCQRVLGPDHPDTLASVNGLIDHLNQQGKYEDAATFAEEFIGRVRPVSPDAHRRRLQTTELLAEALLGLERYVDAEATLLDAYEAIEAGASDGRRETRLRRLAECIGNLYDAWGRTDAAAEWRGRADGDP